MRTHICTLMLLVTKVACGQSFPADINKDSLSRFPVVMRSELDEAGKKAYDVIAGGPGKTVLPTGPAAIGVYSPQVYERLHTMNNYLRKEGVLGERLTELAILVASREVDEQYTWSAHETAALKAGIAPSVIDVVKYNRDLSGLEEKEAAIIHFGRQLFQHKKMPTDLFAKTVELFGRRGVVELTVLMGDYQLNGLLLKVADQHLPSDRKALLPPR